MTKKDLAKAIAGETGLTQEKVREIVQRVFDRVTETLVDEGRIELRNFGVFEVKKRKPRRAHVIRSTHWARQLGGSNGSAKYCVSCSTLPAWNSMMLTVLTRRPS